MKLSGCEYIHSLNNGTAARINKIMVQGIKDFIAPTTGDDLGDDFIVTFDSVAVATTAAAVARLDLEDLLVTLVVDIRDIGFMLVLSIDSG